ncbi:POTRA domain-containing protein [Flagellimonas meridianipacifica]|uniref:Surface antigen-like variable number repeat protein n=1 Tax=Flagellimonas meridianipacifica TaxID=1080225 RepID=A0A2T0MFR8_9FLAO|nr:POTRA domain-containing protein [Allomuricauda pacifica]PRX56413.1 surface antigen-like variable number repeat protein [Allomuricauda pacifica]
MIHRCLVTLTVFLVVFFGYGQTPTIASLKIQGNEKTKTSFLEKIIKLEVGTSLDTTKMEEDMYRLKRLPSVSHAYYQVSESFAENQVDVVYGIEENFTLIPFASIFTSNDDEFAFRVGLQEFNVLGRNITLGGFYQRDIFDSFGAHIRAPNIFGRRWGLALSYQDLTTEEPVFLDNGSADYRYNNESIEALVLFQLNFKNRFEFGINFFTEDYQFLSGDTDPSVPLALRVNKHLLKLLYNYDAIKFHYQYLSGFKSSLNLQYVRSDDGQLPPFWIGFNDFTYFLRVGEKGNWASRLRLGLSSNLDTPFAPFAVDNNLNIRGVGNLIDRGTAAIVLNTEYRHTLIDKDWFVLQSNVFVDGGSWRNPGGDFSDFGDDQNLRIYPGMGLRFIHKRIFNAIFRIDYGQGITPNSSRGVVFGIGQYF